MAEKSTCRPEVVAIRDEIIANRRHFHQHPELSYEEVETAKYIVAQLKSYGFDDIKEGVARTGVVALLKGSGGDGPVILLRADMDALPILESGDLPFKSQNENVMHACGHDTHMAMLLGAAKVLMEKKAQINGTVKFVFQPAEEGFGGGRVMVEEGVLENPHVDEVYGCHIWTYGASGEVGALEGPVMGASDRFHITITGRGGHGAVPQGTADAIVAATHLVTSLHTIVPRNINPLHAAVVTVGKINGGFNANVIADEVKMSGTTRAFDANDRDLIHRRIREMVAGIATTFDVKGEVDIVPGYPVTANAKECTKKLRVAARKIVGETGVHIDDDNGNSPYKTMAAEDFSFFLIERPGCFWFIGGSDASVPPKNRVPHHKSNFTICESSLTIGSSVFVQLIDDLLINNLVM